MKKLLPHLQVNCWQTAAVANFSLFTPHFSLFHFYVQSANDNKPHTVFTDGTGLTKNFIGWQKALIKKSDVIDFARRPQSSEER
jgi:hypothetical protein